MEKLKPCPFCGGEAIQDVYTSGSCQIYCKHCYGVHGGETLAEGTKKWNTRASQWINNEEEEPHEEGMYLVVLGGEHIETLRYQTEGGWFDLDGEHRVVTVTHWQRLPKLPKAKQKVKEETHGA